MVADNSALAVTGRCNALSGSYSGIKQDVCTDSEEHAPFNDYMKGQTTVVVACTVEESTVMSSLPSEPRNALRLEWTAKFASCSIGGA